MFYLAFFLDIVFFGNGGIHVPYRALISRESIFAKKRIRES